MKTLLFPKDTVPYTQACVALGNFDGVHKGHHAVISKCAELAKKMNTVSAVYTFLQHPKTVFSNFSEVITNNHAKESILAQTIHPDFLIFQQIDMEFLKQSPAQFVKKILKEQLKAKAVVVGSHYSFGKNGQGDAALLKTLCKEEDIYTEIVPLLFDGNTLLSSTAIRAYIHRGEIEKANEMLGYKFFIEGEVVHGNHIGTTIGFPTININPDKHQLLPAYGVYATETEIQGKQYIGVTNVGVKPTIGLNTPVVETNLFDVCEDFYGAQAKVQFITQLRSEHHFASIEALKKQIEHDSKTAKQVLE